MSATFCHINMFKSYRSYLTSTEISSNIYPTSGPHPTPPRHPIPAPHASVSFLLGKFKREFLQMVHVYQVRRRGGGGPVLWNNDVYRWNLSLEDQKFFNWKIFHAVKKRIWDTFVLKIILSAAISLRMSSKQQWYKNYEKKLNSSRTGDH